MNKVPSFQDFNFKLAVINKLMYESGVLRPRFDVYDFVRNHAGRVIDLDAEGYEIIPEVREYFERLEIPLDGLGGIQEIFQDGGDEIYMQLCPFWDGEDDRFNIRSAEDARLLPNLKKVTLFFDGDDSILHQFRERGIEAEWL